MGMCDVSAHGQVMDAVKCAWKSKKTPLLVDASADDRDDPQLTGRGSDAEVAILMNSGNQPH